MGIGKKYRIKKINDSIPKVSKSKCSFILRLYFSRKRLNKQDIIKKFKILFPELYHREIFKLCAKNWKFSKQNSKNFKKTLLSFKLFKIQKKPFHSKDVILHK